MYVCIQLTTELPEPYNIVPLSNAFQNYTVPNELLQTYLQDGFEVVCIDPRLISVIKDAEEPMEFYDTGRFVYMVKEVDNVNSFDQNKYQPDNYDCTLMYEREDWIHIQNLTDSFRRKNDPFCAHDVLPPKEFPCWPGAVTEPTPDEKAAEKERIQGIYDSLQHGEVQPEDIDIIDLLVINGMMRKELDKKEKDLKLFKSLMRQYEDEVSFEELRRQLLEYEVGTAPI